MNTPASATPKTTAQSPQTPVTIMQPHTQAPQNHPYTYPSFQPNHPMPPQAGAPPKPPRPFTKKEWIIFALAGLEAFLFLVFFNIGATTPDALPGIGLSLMIYTHMALLAFALGSTARYDRYTIPLIAATLLLGAFPALYGNVTLRALNLLVTWVLLTVTSFMLANLWEKARIRLTVFLAAMIESIISLFAYIPRPFDAILSLHINKNGRAVKKMLPTFAGLALAILSLIVVLPLLFSADAIFAHTADKIFSTVFDFDGVTLFVRIIVLVIAWPAFFGILWGLTHTSISVDTTRSATARLLRTLRLPAQTSLILLATLIAVYLAFIWVQAVYLFGGRTAMDSTMTYAEYARSGFFQLVAVTAINVAIALAGAYSAHRRPDNGGLSTSPMPVLAVRAGVVVLVIETGVILASALMRMNLYVDAYGLTLLRALTYLGMAFIALSLIAVCIYTFRGDFNIFAATFVTGIVVWAAFTIANPDARIAEYNVNHYLSGDMETIDVRYFSELSPSTIPALEKLEKTAPDANIRYDAQVALREQRAHIRDSAWNMWSLSFRNR